MVNRIGNVALYNSTMKDVTGVQQKLATLQEQISSGLKAKDFAGLDGQVEQYTLLQNKMRTAEKYIETNSVTVARLKTADQAMTQITDIADSMENLIVTARSGAVGDTASLDLQMRNLMKQLGEQMNINFEGRYLLGGTNTNMPPVPDPLATPVSIGTPDASYYSGSQDNLVYNYDERSSFEWPVRADDPAFQKIMAAANQALQAMANKDDAGLSSALDTIQSGQQDLVASRSRLNSTIINVESQTEQLTSMKLYWKGVSDQVVNTDLVAATTEVSNHEAILQAAFAVFSRLSQLRLSDYLR